MSQKILIVDDAKVMRMLLSKVLVGMGLKDIVEGVDVEDGIEQFKANNPDLTILDITMPSQFPDRDGIFTLKSIKELNPGAKVIMCSARGQKEKVKEAILAGASDFIVKPFQEARVQESVKKALGI